MNDATGARPLSDLQRDVLMRLLSVEFKGVAELRGQAQVAQVVGLTKPGESPGFDIWLPEEVAVSPCPTRLAPISAHVISADGSFTGEFLLWLAHGRLSSVEYAWVTDEVPTELPSPARIRVATRGDAK